MCRAGASVIEPRIVIAYALIALLLVAAVVVVRYLRYNNPRRKEERERRRIKARYRERFPERETL